MNPLPQSFRMIAEPRKGSNYSSDLGRFFTEENLFKAHHAIAESRRNAPRFLCDGSGLNFGYSIIESRTRNHRRLRRLKIASVRP